jgi:hypothetical protein
MIEGLSELKEHIANPEDVHGVVSAGPGRWNQEHYQRLAESTEPIDLLVNKYFESDFGAVKEFRERIENYEPQGKINKGLLTKPFKCLARGMVIVVWKLIGMTMPMARKEGEGSSVENLLELACSVALEIRKNNTDVNEVIRKIMFLAALKLSEITSEEPNTVINQLIKFIGATTKVSVLVEGYQSVKNYLIQKSEWLRIQEKMVSTVKSSNPASRQIIQHTGWLLKHSELEQRSGLLFWGLLQDEYEQLISLHRKIQVVLSNKILRGEGECPGDILSGWLVALNQQTTVPVLKEKIEEFLLRAIQGKPLGKRLGQQIMRICFTSHSRQSSGQIGKYLETLAQQAKSVPALSNTPKPTETRELKEQLRQCIESADNLAKHYEFEDCKLWEFFEGEMYPAEAVDHSKESSIRTLYQSDQEVQEGSQNNSQSGGSNSYESNGTSHESDDPDGSGSDDSSSEGSKPKQSENGGFFGRGGILGGGGIEPEGLFQTGEVGEKAEAGGEVQTPEPGSPKVEPAEPQVKPAQVKEESKRSEKAEHDDDENWEDEEGEWADEADGSEDGSGTDEDADDDVGGESEGVEEGQEQAENLLSEPPLVTQPVVDQVRSPPLAEAHESSQMVQQPSSPRLLSNYHRDSTRGAPCGN